jgi:hypothetical protein
MEERTQRRRVTRKCAAQIARAQTFLIIADDAISEDPDPALWFMAAKDEARDRDWRDWRIIACSVGEEPAPRPFETQSVARLRLWLGCPHGSKRNS